MNGARGTVVAAPPFVPAVPEASGFHSREAFCLPREAKGLVHPSPGQGRLGLKTKKHPQAESAESLPHHSAYPPNPAKNPLFPPPVNHQLFQPPSRQKQNPTNNPSHPHNHQQSAISHNQPPTITKR